MSDNDDKLLHDAKRLVQERVFADNKFENIFQEIKVISVGKGGNLTCEFEVKPGHRNSHGTLHGGIMASLVDSVTSWAFHAFVTDKRSMSMDLHMTYMRAVPIGKKILIEARTIKHGRRVVFLEADIKSSDGTLYARALHTKLIMEKLKL